MNFILRALVLSFVCFSCSNGLEISRKIAIQSDASQSGVSYSKYDAASHQLAMLDEEMKGAAGEAASFGGMESRSGAGSESSASDSSSSGSSSASAFAAAEAGAGGSSFGSGSAGDSRSASAAGCEEPTESVDTDKVEAIINNPEGFYVVLSTLSAYKEFAKGLKGAEINSEEDLKDICLKSKFDGTVNHVTAFKTKDSEGFSHECACEAEGNHVTCRTPSGSATFSYLSNDDKYALIGVCLPDGKGQGWAVISCEKEIDDETATKFIEKAQAHSYDVEEPRSIDYSNCA